MKWDIDKALDRIDSKEQILSSRFERVVMGLDYARTLGLKLTKKEETDGSVVVWCFSVGPMHLPKLFVYGRTVRATYLKGRKLIKQLTLKDREQLGVCVPKKSNSYMKARRLRKKVA